MSAPRQKVLVPWARSASVVIVLAVLLAGLGLLLAIRQVRSGTQSRIDSLRPAARELIDRANQQIAGAVEAVLRPILVDPSRRQGDRIQPVSAPPPWISDIYLWDGQQIAQWSAEHAAQRIPKAFAGTVPLEPRDLARGWLELKLAEIKADLAAPRVRFLTDVVADQTYVLGYLGLTDPRNGSRVGGCMVDLNRFREAVIEPAVEAIGGLATFRTGEPPPAGGWGEPMSPVLSFWSIGPTEWFIAAQHRAVKWQTAVYVALTMLILAALLVVVLGMLHVVRQEIAVSSMKSAFVADVSHELKTPLALIRMFGETLQSGRVNSPERAAEYYAIIVRESTRLTHLINNILDFSRIESGVRQYQFAPVDIESIICSTYESYQYDLDHQGFQHRVDFEPGLPPIMADADAISQALLNLISNAIKYSDADKALEIHVGKDIRRGKRGVLVSVKDHGIGIRPEDRAKLFSAFYRAKDERVRKKRGAGLGLSLVKHIVEAHGGEVEVEARLIKGTTFRIFLPAADQEPESVDGQKGAGSVP